VVRPDHVIAAECLAQELDETLQKVLTAARVIRPAAAELGLAADAARLAELATDPEAAPVG
jgi:3-(3-hydroxy-phenyl)propionate hydroxylase